MSILNILAWIGKNPVAFGAIIVAVFIIFPLLVSHRQSKARHDSAQQHTPHQQDASRLATELLKKDQEIHDLRSQLSEEKRRKSNTAAGIYDVPVFPPVLDGLGVAYSYKDVEINPLPHGHLYVVPSDPLILEASEDKVQIFQGDYLLGTMKETRIAGMVRDWEKDDLPFIAFVASYATDDSSAMIAIAFYSDLLKRFTTHHDLIKHVTLVGKADDFVLDHAPGDECSVEYDFDKEKYGVECGSDFLGFLPSSAVSFAENNNVSPDDLEVVFDSVKEDDDKTHYCVYISAD